MTKTPPVDQAAGIDRRQLREKLEQALNGAARSHPARIPLLSPEHSLDIVWPLITAELDRVPPEPQAWQPMETAPKDGTPIIVHVADDRQFTIARWTSLPDEVCGGTHECFADDSGWPDPLAWMPLPSPPIGPSEAR